MKLILISISSILLLVSPVIYIRAMFRGEAKPQRMTKFILLLITSLATLSLYAQHNTVVIWLAGVSAVQAGIVFLLSIKFGMGGWSKSDILCFVIAIAGIILWQTTNNPLLGLYASILADFTGMIPAVIKTYRLPETEIWSYYFIDVVAASCTLFAITSWTIQEISYPLYLIGINLLMVFLVVKKNIRPAD